MNGLAFMRIKELESYLINRGYDISKDYKYGDNDDDTNLQILLSSQSHIEMMSHYGYEIRLLLEDINLQKENDGDNIINVLKKIFIDKQDLTIHFSVGKMLEVAEEKGIDDTNEVFNEDNDEETIFKEDEETTDVDHDFDSQEGFDNFQGEHITPYGGLQCFYTFVMSLTSLLKDEYPEVLKKGWPILDTTFLFFNQESKDMDFNNITSDEELNYVMTNSDLISWKFHLGYNTPHSWIKNLEDEGFAVFIVTKLLFLLFRSQFCIVQYANSQEKSIAMDYK